MANRPIAKLLLLTLWLLFFYSTALANNPMPRYVAVLPVTGEGSAEKREDVRTALHNALGATNYRLRKMGEIDQVLGNDKTIDLDIENLIALCARLQVDGLLIAEQTNLERLYAAAYAHYEVSVRVRLFDAKSQQFVWTFEREEAEREGGISVDILGFLATAYESSTVLRDVVRLQLIDTLAREFAKEIPKPQSIAMNVNPVNVSVAASNYQQGPFTTGESIKVWVKTEPNIKLHFRLQGIGKKITLTEQQAGNYVGNYVVSRGDDIDSTVMVLSLQRKDERPTIWQVPGKIAIDTTAPEAVDNLSAFFSSESVTLNWQGDEAVDFTIERADTRNQNYQTLNTTAILSYTDTDFIPGQSYLYRITPVDKAGNTGKGSVVRVTTERLGPTLVDKDIVDNIRFSERGSPYIIQGKITISGRLVVDAGAVIDFKPNSSFSVTGKMTINGKSSQPVLLNGKNWSLDSLGSKNTLKMDHAIIRGGRLSVSDGTLSIANSNLREVNLSIAETSKASRIKDSTFVDSGITLRDTVFPISDCLFDNSTVTANKAVVLNQPTFGAADYLKARQWVGGAIAIAWPAQSTGDHLLANWLQSQWQTIGIAIQEKNWPKALEVLQATLSNSTESAATDAFETVYLIQNPEAQAVALDDATLLSTFIEQKAKGQVLDLIWLPDTVLTRAADFNNAYIETYYPKAASEKILPIDQLSLKGFIESELAPDYAPGRLFLVNKQGFEATLAARGYLRAADPFISGQFIHPRNDTLCTVYDPWILGEGGNSNAVSCFAVTIETRNKSYTTLLGYNDNGQAKKLFPCGPTKPQQRWHMPVNQFGQKSVFNAEDTRFQHYFVVISASEQYPESLAALDSLSCEEVSQVQQLQEKLVREDRLSGGRTRAIKL
ncbi:fibronectin type III domain-containing protein [Oceanicoccus sagamiensis]|uniref:Fibronectin type-III domain-containing protein n=1 Tax=Oceanicoccus sagamiensis TaxID=716816 RepID=A0A1X9NDU9_9GAMM|nr:fibronectin type III domain-containing protein [Oceanicoccus sagamiensis]ARN73127.1 hypothetical protein BST96_02800 [Oceanicoccus sagamiensis]